MLLTSQNSQHTFEPTQAKVAFKRNQIQNFMLFKINSRELTSLLIIAKGGDGEVSSMRMSVLLSSSNIILERLFLV
jgi:hypothetical protein